ncbi:polar amino acid transport system substrate-binding protein [Mesorhizobium soli]|uniref:ABC transporter substrate-binding protein n=1 Tax=Pseudaminobacter soli (ex Li et al. 2025) TaxID=1295366 RepID=UPI002476EDEA|nr:ABC transporter substrate-binding protein [Mesorhizobium soli]MDH6233134.1 polar amino acid transport system substrate-binding protein [Mesorhizobium soli]
MSANKSTISAIFISLLLSFGSAVHAEGNPELRAMLPDSIRNAGVIHVASDYPFPPYEYFNAKNELTGVEYDLTQEAGALLGVKFEWHKQPFDGIIPGLAAGKYDIALSAFSDTISRQKVVDFIDFSVSQGAMVVPKGSDVKGKLDICGRRMSTQRGSNGEKSIADLSAECVKRGKKPVEAVVLPSGSDVHLAIKAGKADASINEAATAAYVAQTVDGGKAFDFVIYNDLDNQQEPIGIAVPKDSEQLRDAIQATLQRLIDNGTYKTIMRKYNIEPLSVKKIEINTAKE